MHGQTSDGWKNVNLEMTGAKMAAFLDKSPVHFPWFQWPLTPLVCLTGAGQLRDL